MDIRQLRYFVRIVEVGSITKAAEELRVAQPALSSAMRKLEKELGTSLLERHSRGVATSEAGSILFGAAREVLDKMREITQSIREKGDQSNSRFIVGLNPSVSSLLAIRLLRSYAHRAHGVTLSLSEEFSRILIDQVEDGSLDVAIGYQTRSAPNLIFDPLLDEDVFFVTSPANAAGLGGQITWSQIGDRPLSVLSVEGKGFVQDLAQDAASFNNVRLNFAFEMHSTNILARHVQEGWSDSLLSELHAKYMIAEGALAGCRVEQPSVPLTIYLIYTVEGSQRREVQALRNVVREICQSLPDVRLR